MADGNDRYDNEGGGGGSFVMGLLTGTVLGAGLGMLFAPKSGSDLRNQLSEQAGKMRDTASEGYRRASETAGDWAEKGRDVVDKARDAVARGADEAQRYARDVTGAASGPVRAAALARRGRVPATARPDRAAAASQAAARTRAAPAGAESRAGTGGANSSQCGSRLGWRGGGVRDRHDAVASPARDRSDTTLARRQHPRVSASGSGTRVGGVRAGRLT